MDHVNRRQAKQQQKEAERGHNMGRSVLGRVLHDAGSITTAVDKVLTERQDDPGDNAQGPKPADRLP